jgi:hypothetical protein
MTRKPSDTATLQAKDTGNSKKPKMGRPTVMTAAVQLEICARLSAGESLTKICKDPSMPNRHTVTKYASGEGVENLEFAARYAQARDRLLEVYADEIIEIADDGTTDYIMKTGRNGHEYEAVDQEHIQRSRLRVDSRKWILSKLRPETYGDKVQADVSGKVAVTHDISTLSEREKMRRLALFMVEDQRQPAIDGQADDVTEQGMEHGDSEDITPASQPSPTE